MRGDVLWVDFGDNVGSEQNGERPAVVIQNNVGNRFSPTYIVLALTSKSKNPLPTHRYIDASRGTGLSVPSTAMCEQIKTVDRSRIRRKLGNLNYNQMAEIDSAILISLGFKPIGYDHVSTRQYN